MLTSAKKKIFLENFYNSNFSSAALFVYKLFIWGNFTPPQLFNVHKESQLEKG